jgi:protein TonB
MKREIAGSIILHALVIALALIAPDFGDGKTIEPGEVIQVSLVSFPEMPAGEEVSLPQSEEPIVQPQPSTPPPVEEDIAELPVTRPDIQPEAPVEPQPIPEETAEPAEEPAPEETAPPETQQRPAAGPTEEEGNEEIHVPPTAGSSPLAGATIDNRSFNYPYWFTQAFNKILRNWRNPVSSDIPIVCVVNFRVIKSGRVIDLRVVESSGIPSFDDACLRAVEKSSPFPPLPRQFADEVIGLTLPFKYEPR